MMDCIGLLIKIVKGSGLTHEEITDRCEADKVEFNYNYISAAIHSKRPPVYKKARAIAKACGRHEDLLVAQAYYDKAPQICKDMFDSLIHAQKTTILKLLELQSDEAAIVVEKKKLDELAFGEWIEFESSGLIEQINSSFSSLVNIDQSKEMLNSFVTQKMEHAFLYIAPDDSMSETIPKGAQVCTKLIALENLKDGDFICLPKDDTDEIYIRKIEFDYKCEKIILLPLNNKGYKTRSIEASNDRLYAKVTQIIINLE